jgi:hypothetical protein
MRVRRSLGHQPNLETLRSELYQLLATFLASKPIAEAASSEHEHTKQMLDVQNIENDIVARLLLSISVTLRVLDDREEGKLEMLSLYCGILTKNQNNPADSTGGMTLREACNKIIHADEVELDRSPLAAAHAHLNPYVYLSGSTQQGKPWSASLNVVQFVREGLAGISLAKGAA